MIDVNLKSIKSSNICHLSQSQNIIVVGKSYKLRNIQMEPV